MDIDVGVRKRGSLLLRIIVAAVLVVAPIVLTVVNRSIIDEVFPGVLSRGQPSRYSRQPGLSHAQIDAP
jgi:hypothetical protein